ncbi:hypothetical protein ACFY1P_24795 [Streptomyces sp. NPDC001407]|uniref:hypothetical protein n=1 Tax=unclassified Streptomyces TaxID=2593676 RepID=UPI00367CA8A0
MDPITAAALTALAGGLGGEAARQAWQGLSALVRRPFSRGGALDAPPGVSTGELELASLADAPADPARAQALATALGVRAALDGEFRGLLDEWWQRTQAAQTAGDVHNHISGGTQAEVFQGRDFSSITLHVHRDAGPADRR